MRKALFLMTVVALVAVSLSGCAVKASSEKGGQFEGIDWKLANYWTSGTMETVAQGTIITAKFENGNLSGKAVNTYNATYTTEASGSLKIGPVAATKMAGPQDQMDAEQLYFAALDKTASYFSDGSTLKLFDAEGNELLIYAKAGK